MAQANEMTITSTPGQPIPFILIDTAHMRRAIIQIERRAEAEAHRIRMYQFARGARQRLAIRQHQLEHRRERAFAAGKMDARMVGPSAKQAARVLYFDDGEAAVCYMNGIDDAVAGL